MTEAEIQSQILIEVSKRGHRLWRSNAGNIKSEHGYFIKLFPRGFPDLVGYRKNDGKFIVIEVKKPTGRLSKYQKKFAEFAKEQPIIYGVARSAKEAVEIIEGAI